MISQAYSITSLRLKPVLILFSNYRPQKPALLSSMILAHHFNNLYVSLIYWPQLNSCTCIVKYDVHPYKFLCYDFFKTLVRKIINTLPNTVRFFLRWWTRAHDQSPFFKVLLGNITPVGYNTTFGRYTELSTFYSILTQTLFIRLLLNDIYSIHDKSNKIKRNTNSDTYRVLNHRSIIKGQKTKGLDGSKTFNFHNTPILIGVTLRHVS